LSCFVGCSVALVTISARESSILKVSDVGKVLLL